MTIERRTPSLPKQWCFKPTNNSTVRSWPAVSSKCTFRASRELHSIKINYSFLSSHIIVKNEKPNNMHILRSDDVVVVVRRHQHCRRRLRRRYSSIFRASFFSLEQTQPRKILTNFIVMLSRIKNFLAIWNVAGVEWGSRAGKRINKIQIVVLERKFRCVHACVGVAYEVFASMNSNDTSAIAVNSRFEWNPDTMNDILRFLGDANVQQIVTIP